MVSCHLFLNSFYDVRMTVAKAGHSCATAAVEVSLAVFINDVAAITAHCTNGFM